MQPSDLYRRHFSRFLGKPFDIERYRADDDASLQLATFDQRYRPFKTYASLGLSDQRDKVKDLGEVIFLSDDHRPDVRELFTHFLLFILQKKIPLGSRFSIGGVEMLNSDFADHYDKTALYVMLAEGFDKGFEEFDCGGEMGRVYQGIFISSVEQDFLRRSGPDVFEDRLRQQGAKELELCALNRPSCVG